MATLAQVAQMAESMFYQDYAPDDAFFNDVHFKFMCGATYATMVKEEFEQKKRENRILFGFSWYELSPEWLVSDILDVKEEAGVQFVELPNKPFTFSSFDPLSSGIQFVSIVDGDCTQLMRISLNEEQNICRMPSNNKVFYFVKPLNKRTTRIVFKNAKCKLKKVDVLYVPSLDSENDDSIISDDMVVPVITAVLNLMFGAKNGNIIDKTNDSNPNVTPASEIDPKALKQI